MPKEKAKVSKTKIKTTSKSKTVAEVTAKVTTKAAPFGIINVIAIIVVLAIFGGIGYFSSRNTKANKSDQAVAAVSAITYDGEDGKNALELLKNKADVQTQDSSIGVFVVGINGVSDTEDHFWMFYVNSELAQSTPDQYITKNGEKIEWRYEQFN